MEDKGQMRVRTAADAAVWKLKNKGLDCVVLCISQEGKYCIKSSMDKTYTWVLMDEVLAELHQEIEQHGQSIGENQLTGKE